MGGLSYLFSEFFNAIFHNSILNNAEVQVHHGGAGSSKTVSIAQRAALDTYDKRNYLVCRKVASTIRETVYSSIVNGIRRLGLDKEFKCSVSPLKIINLKTGYGFYFRGLDSPEKINGIDPDNGAPVTDIWFEEAPEITKHDYNTLLFRQRGIHESKTRKILTLNPLDKKHWIYDTFFKNKWKDNGDKIQYFRGHDLLITKTNHWDNPFLATQNHLSYEKTRLDSEYFYQVYCLGNWGIIGERVFENIIKANISQDFINSQNKILPGLDWGYYPDPYAFTQSSISRGNLYSFYETGGNKYSNLEIAQKISYINDELVYCDSAEPKSIAELQKYGINAVGAKKNGLRRFFVQWANSRKWFIDFQKCPKLFGEATSYTYAKDKNGETINDFVDGDDHWIDATMYGVSNEMQYHIPTGLKKAFTNMGYYSLESYKI
jgi:phage terminase large subunit